MKFVKFIFVVFLFQITVSYSQNDNKIIEIINKSTEKYLGKSSIAISLSYNLFGSYSSKKVIQTYNGISVSSNKKSYLKIHNTEFINTPDLSFKINHDQKLALIYLSNKNNGVDTQNPINIKEFLKYFNKKTLTTIGNSWVIELETSVLTQMPYGKVKIYINKTDFTIERQVLYLLDSIPQNQGEALIPRLEIVFNELKKTDSEIASLLNLNKFLIKQSNSYVLTRQFDSYKLLKY